MDGGCRDCEIEVTGRRLPFAFTLIDMVRFDVILGMDWLSFYQAIIDCCRQRVTMYTSSGDYYYFMGDRVDRALLLVYDPRGWGERSLLLATLLGVENDVVRVEFPRVVCECPDVFPENFTIMAPHREIEFSIDLVPGTTPIYMALYRFAPTELSELKIELQELLDKGFIRPSTLP
ncbi:hypothetical protein ACSBR2_039584 [Camellia fascicularis]